jgi:hypothetical protein
LPEPPSRSSIVSRPCNQRGDTFCPSSDELPYGPVVTNVDHGAVPDRQGFGDTKTAVQGQDATAVQHKIRRAALLGMGGSA